MSKKVQTLIFLAICCGILVFFLLAPESTTPRMPRDGNHPRKSTDFAACFQCHPPRTLPGNHTVDGETPPEGKQKCYFCHKLEREKKG